MTPSGLDSAKPESYRIKVGGRRSGGTGFWAARRMSFISQTHESGREFGRSMQWALSSSVHIFPPNADFYAERHPRGCTDLWNLFRKQK